MPVQIQLRRGTTSDWSTANPTLSSGEVGVDTTLVKFKVGNGATAWNALQYATLTFRGAYASGTTYYPNDLVTYTGSSYVCILQSAGNLPTNTTYFSLLAQAGTNGTNGTNGVSFTWQGAYNNATTYAANNVVSYNNSTYICILASTGNLPTNATYWSLMAAAGAGDVVGPAAGATDNVLAVFDGATGKLLKNSAITISGAAGSVGFIGAPQQSGGSSAYTAAITDQGKHIIFTNGSTPATLTIPLNVDVGFPVGTVILVVNDNTSTLTISGPGGAGVTFQLANSTSGNSRTVASKGLATCLKTGTNTWYVSGAGVT